MAAEATPITATQLARELGEHGWFLISIAQEIASGRATSVGEAKLLAEVDPAVAERARGWAREISRGVPMQYATGRADFLGHVYEVQPGVLIPRPETEVLVLETIRRLRTQTARRGFEWGIGSGIISIELLHSSRDESLEITAIDISPVARQVAAQNAARILGDQARRLRIRETWAEDDRDLDFIVSNPPYLDPAQEAEFDASVAHSEPAEALFAPPGDLIGHYKELAREAQTRLRAGGLVSLEVPHERALDIRALFSDNAWKRAELLPDLTGRPRVFLAERK